MVRLCSIHFIVSLAGQRKIVCYTESSLYRQIGFVKQGFTVYEQRGAPVVQTLYTDCTNLRPFSLKGVPVCPQSEFQKLSVQGHPMDLFHKISVRLAIFCWLGDHCNDMSLEGKCCWVSDNSGRCLREFDVWNGLSPLLFFSSGSLKICFSSCLVCSLVLLQVHFDWAHVCFLDFVAQSYGHLGNCTNL